MENKTCDVCRQEATGERVIDVCVKHERFGKEFKGTNEVVDKKTMKKITKAADKKTEELMKKLKKKTKKKGVKKK